MKFIGHCPSVIKSFGSNFASMVSMLEKLNTPETEGLQEKHFESRFHTGLSFHVRYYVSI